MLEGDMNLIDEIEITEKRIREIDRMISDLQAEKRHLERQYRYKADIIMHGEPSPALKKAYG